MRKLGIVGGRYWAKWARINEQECTNAEGEIFINVQKLAKAENLAWNDACRKLNDESYKGNFTDPLAETFDYVKMDAAKEFRKNFPNLNKKHIW